MRVRSNVLTHPAASSEAARDHYSSRLAYETDCADVAAAIDVGIDGFAVVDCRSPQQYALGHVPGALNIPYRRISRELTDELIPDRDALIVTYCNGPHCNASTRGALRFAQLGRPVKEMPGGFDGWRRENLRLEAGTTETTLGAQH